MTARRLDPHRLDVEVFAREGGELDGIWPLASFARLAESTVPAGDAAVPEEVVWSARGEQRTRRGQAHEIRLHTTARTRVALTCQRCLEPVTVDVAAERSFLFVADEAAAAELDAQSDDDVLALSRALDLHELLEDELLLGLPLVPRHAVCSAPLPVSDDAPVDEEAAPHPFSALETLKRGGPVN